MHKINVIISKRRAATINHVHDLGRVLTVDLSGESAGIPMRSGLAEISCHLQAINQ